MACGSASCPVWARPSIPATLCTPRDRAASGKVSPIHLSTTALLSQPLPGRGRPPADTNTALLATPRNHGSSHTRQAPGPNPGAFKIGLFWGKTDKTSLFQKTAFSPQDVAVLGKSTWKLESDPTAPPHCCPPAGEPRRAGAGRGLRWQGGRVLRPTSSSHPPPPPEHWCNASAI